MAGKKLNIDSLNLGLDNPSVIKASEIMNKEISAVKINNASLQEKAGDIVFHSKKNIRKTVTIDGETLNLLQKMKKENYYVNISQLLRDAIKDYYEKLFSK
ncbi:MAG: ribbon-helix-helix domain-containing protein [Spiroplasma sp. hy2]|uniref:ribbon-helix-helix domain-containing protein n=1 Tax=Spiroplasma sp. hy2 TaxID=2490850 RepID=UPI0038480ABC